MDRDIPQSASEAGPSKTDSRDNTDSGHTGSDDPAQDFPSQAVEPTLLSAYQQLLKELSDLLRGGGALIEDKEAVATVHDALLRIKLWGVDISEETENEPRGDSKWKIVLSFLRTARTLKYLENHAGDIRQAVSLRFRHILVALSDVRMTYSSVKLSPQDGFTNSGSLDYLAQAVDRLTDLAEIIMTYMELASGKGVASGIRAALIKREALQAAAELTETKTPVETIGLARRISQSKDPQNKHYEPLLRPGFIDVPPVAAEKPFSFTIAPKPAEPLRPLSSSNYYNHSPINDDEIRLLILHPGDYDEDIRCSLTERKMDRWQGAPDKGMLVFQAISYSWGRTVSDSEIWVADAPPAILDDSSKPSPTSSQGKFQPFKVRSTVLSVLRQLRDPHEKVLLWIDVLCIDLQNDRETSLQFPNVSKIFAMAADVCLWLGDGNEQTDLAMDFIPEIVDLQNFERLVKDEKNIESWKAFAGLMKHPYFSRRWIIQEVAVARSATLRCGQKLVPWADFSDAVSTLLTNLERVENLFTTHLISPSRSLGDVETSGANLLLRTTSNLFRRSDDGFVLKPLQSLETLLSTIQLTDVTHPHGLIYSLFSIVNDNPYQEQYSRDSIEGTSSGYPVDDLWRVDYDKDVFELYKQVITHCIWSSQSLDIICRKLAFSRPRNSTSSAGALLIEEDEILSWVPFKEVPPYITGRSVHHGRQHAESLVGLPGSKVYNAAGKKKLELEYGVGNGFQFILNVRGFILDTIILVSPRMAEGIVLRECLELVGWTLTAKPDDQEHVLDRLWRIMVADRGPDATNPPTWYKRACLYCLDNITPSGDLDTRALLADYPPEIAKLFLKRVQSVMWNRKMFKAGDFFGLAPTRAEPGDAVCVLFGCSVPVILRRRAAEGWKFIGEAYVHGAMDGETLEGLNKGTVYFELH